MIMKGIQKNSGKSYKECTVFLILWVILQLKVLGRLVIQYKNRESLGTGKVFEENSLIRKKVEYLFSISCFSKVNYFFTTGSSKKIWAIFIHINIT